MGIYHAVLGVLGYDEKMDLAEGFDDEIVL